MNPLRYTDQLQRIAAELCPDDTLLREDIYQDLCVAVLECADDAPRWLCLKKAKRAAINKLKSKQYAYSYRDKFQHISCEALRARGYDIADNYVIYKQALDN